MQPGIIEHVYGSRLPVSPSVRKARAERVFQSMKKAYKSILLPEKIMVITDLKEAIAQGFGGIALDSRLEVQPWGFELAHINVPVLIWHGTENKDVPLTSAEYLLKHLPSPVHYWVNNENHIDPKTLAPDTEGTRDHLDQSIRIKNSEFVAIAISRATLKHRTSLPMCGAARANMYIKS